MTDLVTRLRDDYEKTVALCAEAADEIEHDREHIKTMQAIVNRSADEITRLKARCVVLAAVIHSVEAWHMVPDEDQKP